MIPAIVPLALEQWVAEVLIKVRRIGHPAGGGLEVAAGLGPALVVRGVVVGVVVVRVVVHAVDVVSFGRQSITPRTFEALRQLRGEYDRLLVWADEAQVTSDVILGIGGNAQPIANDVDANELLQAGKLVEFYASHTG